MQILRRRPAPALVAGTKPAITAGTSTTPALARRSRPSAEANTRRMRFTSPSTAASRAKVAADARAAIDEKLKLIATVEQELDDVLARQAVLHEEIEKELRAANLSEHSDGVYKAEILEQISKQSRTIDPKKFKANVADKDFWACVTIGVTKAKEVMTERELDGISDVVPAKSTGYAFTLKKVKRKIK